MTKPTPGEPPARPKGDLDRRTEPRDNRAGPTPRRGWPPAVPWLVVALATAACSAGTGPPSRETPPASPGSRDEPTASAPATATPTPDSPPPAVTGGTSITLAVADTEIPGELSDTATARDLLAQLPLTLSFRDFNQVEKIARLPRPLSLQDAPSGDDPDIGDIGYYAPSQDLVLYYGDVGYWDGIVRLGRFDAAALDLIEGLEDGVEVSVEVSGERS